MLSKVLQKYLGIAITKNKVCMKKDYEIVLDNYNTLYAIYNSYVAHSTIRYRFFDG